MARLTVCSAAGCPEPAPVGIGRCEAHRRKPWSNTSRRNLERPADWWRIRARVFRRDGHRCVAPGCRRKAEHCDHVISIANGGDWSEGNLQSLCKKHHDEKTAAERAERDARRAG